MNNELNQTRDDRARRRASNDVKDALRELRVQLSVLNHHVGVRAGLRDVDLDCLDLLSDAGPLTPRALAGLAGLHPATLTGVLDRLESGGWVTRERDARDRRSILVTIVADRNADMYRHYAGMNSAMDDLCADYDGEQLELIAGFLRRAAGAGKAASEEFTA